ncbi:DUF6177 family protein [Serinicoccus sp. CUA-874]|uniref:DUF6177 family protein n=1 Tax=Serinicoccus sp. CUA-874 TaxID=1517939 RepID=UPI00117A2D95|nr:DUF6177 family protein [Serinicoccus sp. CUA-874]
MAEIVPRRDAGRSHERPLVLRTPAGSRPSAVLRRLLRDHWAIWVREEPGGPVEGLSGLPMRWQDGTLVPDRRAAGRPDRDTASLRVQVLHPLDETQDIGLLTSRVIESLDGHPASVGLTEPALHPWDAGLLAQTARSSAPEPVTWVVEMGEASGTVTLTSSPRGVLEDLSLEVDAVVETVWPAVSDLLPLMMLTTRGGELTGAVLHPTVLPDVELTTRDIGGGYVSVVTHGAEAPVTERLP